MAELRHGLSIGIERHGKDDFFVVLRVVGTLTHADYERMVPVLEGAIAGVKDPDIYLLADVTELDGFEARAMWDDLKLGIKHGRHFEKVAVVGKPGWQEWMTRFADWFTPADARFFIDRQDALEWLGD